MREVYDWIMDRFLELVFAAVLLAVYVAIGWVIVGWCRAGALPLDRVRLQEMESIETADTVLDRGEVVVVYGDDGTATLRLGDGSTAGGRVAHDPHGVRASTARVLGQDEYALIPSGAAAWTDGAWHLLPAGTRSGGSGEGALTLIAGASLAAVEIDGVFIHVAWAVEPTDFISTLTNSATISAVEQEAPGGDTLYYEARLTNLVVYAWTAPHLVGASADLRHVEVLVRTPRGDLEPVPRAWVESRLAGREADSWSAFPADQSVRLNWQDVFTHPYLRFGAGANTTDWRLRWQHPSSTNYVDVFAATVSNMVYSIVAWQQPSATNVRLWVDDAVPFASAPVVQANTNLPGGAWFNLPTTSPWPASEWVTADSGLTYRAYRLDAETPAVVPIFYRVAATNNPAAQEHLLTLGLPVKMSGSLDMAGHSILNVGTGSIHMADGRIISSHTIGEWERSAQRVRQTERGGGFAFLAVVLAWACRIVRRRTGVDLLAGARRVIHYVEDGHA